MRVQQQLRDKITRALAPVRFEIVDESSHHAGHAGARPGGESHFRMTIVSAAFTGKSRVARQRMVYDILAAELASDVHALALTTLTPDEDRR